ncbi:myosin-like coiled-coil protein-domain-containing protein [Kalaharituber pfeilii]|nr:myosin-like coiled-coil protein-domain-containing protein [Kalaharituber pfeilii]
MEEMSKKTKRLERENAQLSRKNEAMNRNILEMAEERTRKEKELNEYKKKYAKIEGICRALQNDRTDLQNKLRGVEGDDLEEEEEEEEEEEDYSGSEDAEHEGSEGDDEGDEDDDVTEDEAQAVERRNQNHSHSTSSGKKNGRTLKAVATSANPIHVQKGVAVPNGAA